ncbi:MAG: CHAT domain-containing protein [Gammaproteobacteria bacterium]|nr:CHAT domain-containing protein [Gammaproteobacteria bacterium]
MPALELTLQHPRKGFYPVSAELRLPGELSQRREAGFAVDEDSRDELRQQELEPEAYGEILGRLVFRNAVRDLYMQARVQAGEAGLHLLLVVEADELRPLRWERLGLPEGSDWSPAALDSAVLFSRYLPSLAERRFPLIGRLDLNALVSLANPPENNDYGLARFDAKTVAAGLDAALGGKLPHTLLTQATLNGLLEQISNNAYTLLHIVAHGWFNSKNGETVLYLLDEQGGTDPVPATRLLKRLKSLKRLPHLIFLSTCDSAKPEAEGANALGGLAHRLVKQLGVPAVIAMSDRVSIATADALAKGFYRRLREHGMPDRALMEAVAPLAERGDILIPALYSRLGGRPLYSDAADRSLRPNEIRHALEQLEQHLPQRAPVQMETFLRLRTGLNPDADPIHLSPAEREDQVKILEDLNALSEDSLGLDFAGLALGRALQAYDRRCPFRGLYYFRYRDRKFFFGRETLIAKLLARLDESPFLAVLGASGSGKSSLILAGLLPKLRRRAPGLRLVYLRPGNAPLAALEETVRNFSLSVSTAEPKNTLKRELQTVLIIDQFEELFTLCNDPEQQRAFVERLMALLPASFGKETEAQTDTARPLPSKGEGRDGDVQKPWRIILTMRADFWGECAPFSALKAAMQARQELIASMNSTELRGAMEQQAQKVGLRFEADLSHAILAEVEHEPGAMPLLQHLLQELWKRRHGRWLKTAEYRELGGIKQAIAHTADRVYRSLDATEKEWCRNLFIRLTRLSEDGSEEHRDTRRRVSLNELVPAGADAALLKALIHKLADTRLVMISGDDQVEVAHEALIQHWQTLRSWLNEDRLALRLLADVRHQAQGWNAGRRTAHHLPRWNAKLEQAEELLDNPRFGATELELGFLQACRALKKKEEREEQEKQRKLRVRLRWAVGVSLVAVMVSVLAWWMYGEAETQKAIAEDRIRIVQYQQQRAETILQTQQQIMKTQSEALVDLMKNEANINYTGNNSGLILSAYSQIELAKGNVTNALLLALEALPKQWSADGKPLDRIYVPQAEAQLYKALQTPHERFRWNHEGRVSMAIFSPDGSRVVTASKDNTARLWDTESGAELAVLHGHEGYVNTAVFSPNGSRVVTASDDRTTRLWDANSGEAVAVLRGHTKDVNTAAFSPNGRWVVTASDDGRALLWDASSGKILSVLRGHCKRYVSKSRYDTCKVITAAFSPDGSRVVTTSNDGTARLWDVSSGEALVVLREHEGGVHTAAFSPDGQQVVTASRETVRLWDMSSGEALSVLRGHEGGVHTAAFSPDGSQIVTAGGYADKTARLWDAKSGETLAVLRGHKGGVYDAAFSPDGSQVVTVGGFSDKTVRLWDARSGKALAVLREHCEGHEPKDSLGCAVMTATFSPDGSRVVTASSDKTARLWDVSSGEALAVLHGHDEAAAFSPDGSRVVTVGGYNDKTARLWDARSGEALTVLRGHKESVYDAAFSPDGSQVVTASWDKTARLWDAKSGKALTVLRGHCEEYDLKNSFDTCGVGTATFSPDGSRVLTASSDKTARVWDTRRGKTLAVLRGHCEGYVPKKRSLHTCRVITATFSPDGSRVVTASSDGTARLWDVKSGVGLVVLRGHEDIVWNAAFSPDGSQVVTVGGDDKTVRLWDVSSGEALAVLRGHCEGHVPEAKYDTCGVGTAAFSPDGSQVVTASSVETVRLWDTDRGEVLAVLRGHGCDEYGCAVNSATFSPDGSRVITASNDKTLRIWKATGEVDAEEMIGKIVPIITFKHQDFVSSATYSPDGTRILALSAGDTYLWRIFPDTRTLVEHAQTQLSRRLTIAQREQFFLPADESLRKAQSLLKQGEQQARAGKIAEAVASFRMAQAKDPYLKDPRAGLDPQRKAEVLAIPTLLKQGTELAKQGELEQATRLFAQVKTLGQGFSFNSYGKAEGIYHETATNE